MSGRVAGPAPIFSLEGKTALVTGGANGLGRMIAEGMLAAGAELIVTSRRDAEAAAAELSATGRCSGVNADLGSVAGIDAVVDAVRARTDKLNILVNNAGRTWGAPLDAFPDAAWEKVLSTNLYAPFALIQRLLPLLEAAALTLDPARVINIGSIAGSRTMGLNAYSYSSSKAALHHLSRELAAELGPRGIAVNTVVPGFFPTKMTAHIRADESEGEDLAQRIPLGRLGRPEDVAGLCVFLASPASAYVSGAQIALDGGLGAAR
jgi:NAD(P)-dependent dehydrogenase (short-subunit alcohol dehydrogenase family)